MTDLGADPGTDPEADELLELEVGGVGNGGVCVARHEGRVVFVRHALPGERVRARVTERTKRFLRADAVEVLEASPDRVQPPCPFAGPGRCGGCDWQHVSLPAQRRLKAAVVAEQLRRVAGIERTVVVEELPHAPDGLGWRTRVQFAVRRDGAVGLHRHRSHDIEPIDECLIAHPGVEAMGIERKPWRGAASVEGVVSAATGDRVVVVRGGAKARVPRLDVPVRVLRGRPEPGKPVPYVREEVSGRLFQVSGGGFWQVHPGAAQVLTDAVLDALRPRPGEIALDLYSGAGLFAAALGERVGPDGLVVAVESDAQAVRDAKFNLRDLPQVAVERGAVADVIAELEFGRADGGSDRAQPKRGDHRGGSRVRGADVVVLDPPRAGAGREVVEHVARLADRRIAYVSCDPATLARDLAYFADRGWTLANLRAFDAFPMTRHVEVLAVLDKG
ncbi:putative RNA methyltransferase [Actinomadura sp. NBRC 104425]|uniref:class I SAM-dependent RNA methyltransferase n=1 Tax=Actinomadura sp. NBRC 104425 TaxID=3032204 RepID=UPI00249F98F4|nr:class I SAM-dependent RNA methyltransferase [Actinomadura sp. NBRC 104425]GLZ13268.1 putative RNA methyltransferase [Actinomadura sp. NBRC 104425]